MPEIEGTLVTDGTLDVDLRRALRADAALNVGVSLTLVASAPWLPRLEGVGPRDR